MAVILAAAVSTSCAAANLPAPTEPEARGLSAPVDAVATEATAASADVPIAPPPETMEGPADLRPAPALLEARPAGTADGTWAVVIGVNDYPGSRYDLRSAVNDAEDVNRALAGMGVPADHRLVLTDGQVTRRTMQQAAEWLVARAGPDAVAVFFFAGHVRKLAAGTEAMIGADGRPMSDGELAAALSRLPARRAWIGIAACYGGGFTEVLAPGRVLTGAAGANEPAYENSSFSRSYMVEFMVRQGMIEGRASQSVQAAYDYARGVLAQRYPNRQPVQFDQLGAPLELRPPGAPPPPPPRRRAPARPKPTTTTTRPSSTSGTLDGDSSSDDEDDDDECEGIDSLTPSLSC